jgi:4-amino-4-deoxy-L-arabinose transferase-like glycosyltransferase
VGLVLPAAVIGPYLLLVRDPLWIFRKETLWMAVAFLLAAAPWYVSLALTGHQEVLSDFFIKHNLQRATDPFNHQQPFWYYGPRLFSDLFPWSLFLPFALFSPVRNEMERRGRLLCWIWLGAVLLIFSLAGSKRGVYLLPLYPAAALLLGKFWDEMFEPWASERLLRWVRGIHGFLGIFLLVAGAGCIGALGYAMVTGRYRNESIWLVPLGALVLTGAGFLIRFLRGRRLWESTAALGLTMAAVFLYAGLVIFPLADRFKSPVPFCRQIKALVSPTEEIRSFGLWRWDAAYIFYTGRLMPVLRSTQELDTYLAQERRVFLLVESSEMDQFLASLKTPARVVLRQDIGHKTTALLTNRAETPS